MGCILAQMVGRQRSLIRQTQQLVTFRKWLKTNSKLGDEAERK